MAAGFSLPAKLDLLSKVALSRRAMSPQKNCKGKLGRQSIFSDIKNPATTYARRGYAGQTGYEDL
jgi:hypothetical protein